MADNKKRNLEPSSVAQPLRGGGPLLDQPAFQAPQPSPQPLTTPTQSVFDFGQAPPAAQEQEDLGLLGNVGTILNILGGVTQSPELSALGGGLLGVLKRQQDKDIIAQKNEQALTQFQTSKAKSRSIFDLATSLGEENPELKPELEVVKLQAEQGDRAGAFAGLRKAAGGERSLRNFEARAKLKIVLQSENFQLASQDVAAGKDIRVAMKERGVPLSREQQRAVKANAKEIKAAAQKPGFFAFLQNLLGFGDSPSESSQLTEQAAVQNFTASRNRPPNEAELARIRIALSK